MANPIGDFLKTVTTSGTAVALSSTSLKVATAVVQALRTNLGSITVGASTVAYSSARGITLGVPAANSTPASISFVSSREGANEIDLADVFIDAQTNGEGVSVVWTKA